MDTSESLPALQNDATASAGITAAPVDVRVNPSSSHRVPAGPGSHQPPMIQQQPGSRHQPNGYHPPAPQPVPKGEQLTAVDRSTVPTTAPAATTALAPAQPTSQQAPPSQPSGQPIPSAPHRQQPSFTPLYADSSPRRHSPGVPVPVPPGVRRARKPMHARPSPLDASVSSAVPPPNKPDRQKEVERAREQERAKEKQPMRLSERNQERQQRQVQQQGEQRQEDEQMQQRQAPEQLQQWQGRQQEQQERAQTGHEKAIDLLQQQRIQPQQNGQQQLGRQQGGLQPVPSAKGSSQLPSFLQPVLSEKGSSQVPPFLQPGLPGGLQPVLSGKGSSHVPAFLQAALSANGSNPLPPFQQRKRTLASPPGNGPAKRPALGDVGMSFGAPYSPQQQLPASQQQGQGQGQGQQQLQQQQRKEQQQLLPELLRAAMSGAALQARPPYAMGAPQLPPTLQGLLQQQQQQQQEEERRGDVKVVGSSQSLQQQQQQQKGLRCKVECGTATGVFYGDTQRIVCHCPACAATAGVDGVEFIPSEFERHGGMAACKKWRFSIKVLDAPKGCSPLGRWLDQHHIVMSSFLSKPKDLSAAPWRAAAAARRAMNMGTAGNQDSTASLQGQLNSGAQSTPGMPDNSGTDLAAMLQVALQQVLSSSGSNVDMKQLLAGKLDMRQVQQQRQAWQRPPPQQQQQQQQSAGLLAAPASARPQATRARDEQDHHQQPAAAAMKHDQPLASSPPTLASDSRLGNAVSSQMPMGSSPSRGPRSQDGAGASGGPDVAPSSGSLTLAQQLQLARLAAEGADAPGYSSQNEGLNLKRTRGEAGAGSGGGTSESEQEDRADARGNGNMLLKQLQQLQRQLKEQEPEDRQQQAEDPLLQQRQQQQSSNQQPQLARAPPPSLAAAAAAATTAGLPAHVSSLPHEHTQSAGAVPPTATARAATAMGATANGVATAGGSGRERGHVQALEQALSMQIERVSALERQLADERGRNKKLEGHLARVAAALLSRSYGRPNAGDSNAAAAAAAVAAVQAAAH